MAKKIRMGILGCGAIGALHARAMRKVEAVKLVAVADAIPGYAHAFADLNKLHAFDSFAAMLASNKIDAVVICTPSGTHAELGIAAAKAGKHVLVEKPMDLFVEKIDQLITACNENRVKLGGIFQNRFPASIQQVKQVIEDGYLGEIVYGEASCMWYRPQSYYDSAAWRGTWETDGGVLANQCIHTIDRLLWLTDMMPKVLAAYCPTLQRQMEAEDLGLALLKFPNGAGGVIKGTTLANPGFPATIVLCGTLGSITIRHNYQIEMHVAGLPDDYIAIPESTTSAGGVSDPMAISEQDHTANIAEFAAAVLEDREPIVNGAEARKAVQLLNEIYRAAGVGPWGKR
ncbi:MAG: Gfo/Idh/MocA family oxidoreductase [bacterium]